MPEAEPSSSPDPSGKKSVLKGALFGVVFTAVGAGAGYGAVVAGLVPVGGAAETTADPGPVFVPIDELTVSIGTGGSFLRMAAHVEVERGTEASVVELMPRITDVLHTYLRSVTATDLEDPDNLLDLRAHMLRRIDLVVGQGAVRDLLIQEYVVN